MRTGYMACFAVGLMLALRLVSAQAADSKNAPGQKTPLQKANSFSYAGKYAEAIDLYKQVEKAEPKNAAAYHMCGRTFALMGSMPEAIEQYKKALEISPTNTELLNDLGVAYSASGQAPQAIEQFKKVVALKPGFVAAYNNMGVIMTETGDFKGAVSAFQASLKMQKNPVIEKRLKQAMAQAGGGQPDEHAQKTPGAAAK